MKKILITGKNSYIGTSFEKSMEQYGESYEIDTLDLKNPTWRNQDFSVYDVVFHVAGIAHADVGKVTEEGKKLYYKVNTDLTIEAAKKFKLDSQRSPSGTAKQFIFMSSIIVYGEETSVNKKRVITKKTVPNPSNFYGDSKLKAELGIQPLEDEVFKVAIIRPPMIYGPGSKGNYQQLTKLALKLPIFPNIKNERSMLFIDNLTEFLHMLIDSEKGGMFFPQNDEYVRTSHMVREIAEAHGKKIYLFSWMNWAVKLLGYLPGKIGKLTNKAFGNLVYEKKNLK
ncbi:NAD-dependent epimerase/dehydratase family protein [Enterococcus rivorum]|uniref:NAD-dependent epimerase n=1 Tax=Enterococcus rivorum TaxID=762845 RepID=A0A1E5KX51_9ENTE|nr:NAD-dependent epimerase/dehydratase family protein [Enterococcus rivorum]MBP2097202.1 UDP-glucose 4-epimerase [Enterococcus rivorum]OEH82441.1 NAD-dependent epimerase [Enterococcus rivorum]